MSLQLSGALSDNVRTRPLVDGRVRLEGGDISFVTMHPSEMFWRQLKSAEFDVSEMSLSSLAIAVAGGDTRWLAIPVYTMRRFFHTGILVRTGSGIEEPADLMGRRVGVPEYQQTSAIWSRGILQHHFGVDLTRIDWFMERGPDRSHGAVTGFAPPPGIRLNQIAADTDIGRMLQAGELDATLLYLNQPNMVDRASLDIEGEGIAHPLFADPAAEGRRYFAETGLQPINHALVVRRSLADAHPWLPAAILDLFERAKAVGEGDTDEKLAYGFAAGRREMETALRYVHEQGLTPRQVAPEELFAQSVLDS